MVKIDCEKLLHRYKRAVISQNEIHKLESKCYELMIKIVDKEVEELEARLLERLRRDEANEGVKLIVSISKGNKELSKD